MQKWNVFKRIIENLKDCDEVFRNGTKDVLKCHGFQKVLVRNREGNIEGHGTLYVKYFCEVLQRQIQSGGKEDTMFCSERRECTAEVFTSSMTNTFLSSSYKKVKKKVMRPFNSRVVWREMGHGNMQSFVRIAQIFGDKTVTRLKNPALVAYPVQASL